MLPRLPLTFKLTIFVVAGTFDGRGMMENACDLNKHDVSRM